MTDRSERDMEASRLTEHGGRWILWFGNPIECHCGLQLRPQRFGWEIPSDIVETGQSQLRLHRERHGRAPGQDVVADRHWLIAFYDEAFAITFEGDKATEAFFAAGRTTVNAITSRETRKANEKRPIGVFPTAALKHLITVRPPNAGSDTDTDYLIRYVQKRPSEVATRPELDATEVAVVKWVLGQPGRETRFTRGHLNAEIANSDFGRSQQPPLTADAVERVRLNVGRLMRRGSKVVKTHLDVAEIGIVRGHRSETQQNRTLDSVVTRLDDQELRDILAGVEFVVYRLASQRWDDIQIGRILCLARSKVAEAKQDLRKKLAPALLPFFDLFVQGYTDAEVAAGIATSDIKRVQEARRLIDGQALKRKWVLIHEARKHDQSNDATIGFLNGMPSVKAPTKGSLRVIGHTINSMNSVHQCLVDLDEDGSVLAWLLLLGTEAERQNIPAILCGDWERQPAGTHLKSTFAKWFAKRRLRGLAELDPDQARSRFNQTRATLATMSRMTYRPKRRSLSGSELFLEENDDE